MLFNNPFQSQEAFKEAGEDKKVPYLIYLSRSCLTQTQSILETTFQPSFAISTVTHLVYERERVKVPNVMSYYPTYCFTGMCFICGEHYKQVSFRPTGTILNRILEIYLG